MLQFLILVLNAQKVNHCLKPALGHVHPVVQDYKTNTSVTSTKRTCVYTGSNIPAPERACLQHSCCSTSALLKAKGPGFNNVIAGSAEPVLVGLEMGLLCCYEFKIRLTTNFWPDFVLPLV